MAAARRELLALHGQVLGRDDVVGQVERPRRRRPRRLPRTRAGSTARSRCGRRCCPCPGNRRARHRRSATTRATRPARRAGRPLDARRQVADHRVEPDVDPLVRVLGVARDRDPHAPVEVARDRARRGSSSSRPSEKLRTFGRQPRAPLDPRLQRVGERGRSRNRCLVSRNSGVEPSIFERGSIRSVGSSWLPQLSHWSPRASGKPQIGHVPSMYRSGSVCPVVGENETSCVRSTIAPFSYSVLKRSCVTRAWFGVVVRVKQSYVKPSRRKSSRMRLVVEVGYLTVGLPFRVCGHHHRRPVLVDAAHRQHVVALAGGDSARRRRTDTYAAACPRCRKPDA